MPAQWTGRIVGELHNNKLTLKELAKEVGWNDKYLSQVINAENTPKGAEQKLTEAMYRLIEKRTEV
jgi:YesN/AraC family two-component response regulator